MTDEAGKHANTLLILGALAAGIGPIARSLRSH